MSAARVSVIICVLALLPLLSSITVDANVLDVQQFKAPQFRTMTLAVENITNYLGVLTQNISVLTDYVGELTSQLDIGPLLSDLSNITGNLEITLANMTGDVDAIVDVVSKELEILNDQVINEFLSDTFTHFSTSLNSNLTVLNVAISSFFNQLNIEVLVGQVVNTCILMLSFFIFWLYFSRFWPNNVEDLTVGKIIRRFGAPAIPLLVCCIVLEIVYIPFLLIEWTNLQGLFIKNLGVIIPMITFLFLLLQLSFALTYCVYLRLWEPLVASIANRRREQAQIKLKTDISSVNINSKTPLEYENIDMLQKKGIGKERHGELETTQLLN